jgi:hypothetical protein
MYLEATGMTYIEYNDLYHIDNQTKRSRIVNWNGPESRKINYARSTDDAVYFVQWNVNWLSEFI